MISTSLTYIHDDVGAVLRGGAPRVDDTGRDLSDRGRLGQLEGFTTGLSVTQTLSPVTTVVLGYQVLHNWGYLQNVYRRANVGNTLAQEEHPDQRTRHTIHGRLAHFVPETQTAFHLMYRAYIDSWEKDRPELMKELLNRGVIPYKVRSNPHSRDIYISL